MVGVIRSGLILLATVLLVIPAVGAEANQAPVVDAGPDQTVLLGDPLMLQGSAQDADGWAM
jgi:hypothetical protein